MNAFWTFIGKYRFLNRKLRALQPQKLRFKINKDFSLYLNPSDLSGPSYDLMKGAEKAFYTYEKHIKKDLMQVLKHDSVFFDVGANIGLISLFVKEFLPNVKIHAFEPAQNTRECLEKTLKENNYKNFDLYEFGVSDQTGEMEIFICGSSSGSSSLVQSNIDIISRTEKMKTITLDDFTKKYKVIPDVIKVDVEGAEDFVIRGASGLIAEHKPTFIIEINNKKTLENMSLWQDTFQDYLVRKAGSENFIEVGEFENLLEVELKKKGIADYLFIPKDHGMATLS